MTARLRDDTIGDMRKVLRVPQATQKRIQAKQNKTKKKKSHIQMTTSFFIFLQQFPSTSHLFGSFPSEGFTTWSFSSFFVHFLQFSCVKHLLFLVLRAGLFSRLAVLVFLLFGRWFEHGKRTLETFINCHHGTTVVKFATVIWSRENGH